MEKEFQKEMLNFKDGVNKKFEQSDAFQKEMLNFKDEVNKKFEQNDAFHKDMTNFKDEMLQFKDDMLQFKSDMLDFKDKTTQTLDDIHKIVILIENELHEKVTTLFDAYSVNNDEHQVFENRICDLENLALKNSTKISSLEDVTKVHSKQLAKLNS